MAPRKVVTPSFQILRRGDVIKTVPVHRSRLVVGSEDGADLRLKHPAIANRHVEIRVVEGRYLEATNLAGEGRVLLGGQPMDRARLREGDELDLGPVSLRLSYSRTDQAPHPDSGPPPAVEDEPTDSDAAAPFEEETTPALPDRTDTPPATAAPTSGSRLGPRKRGPTPVGGAEPAGSMDLDLDDIVLDPTPVVTIEPPGARSQRVPLRVGTFVVGAGRCAFRLSYTGVAPAHAEMMVMPDGLVYLKHLAGAGQLTLRNGAPIQFSRWKSGDRVQVGPVTLHLEMVARDALAEALAESHATPPAAPPKPRAAALPRLEPEPSTRPPEGSVADEVAPPFLTLPGAASAKKAAPVLPPAAAPATPPPGLPPAPPKPIPPPAPPHSTHLPPPAATPPPAFAMPAPSAPAITRPLPATTAPASLPPLVTVRRKGGAPAPERTLSQARPELVTTNTVSVSLDVRAADTYAAHARAEFIDDDVLVDYRPPLWKRAAAPALVALLLLIIAGQAFMYWGSSQARPAATRAVAARGESGIERSEIQAERAGSGPLVVGNPSRGARAGGAAAGGGADDDWVPDSQGRFAGRDDPRASTDALAQLAAARAETGLAAQRPADTEEPVPTRNKAGGGYVEMKDVERVIWAQRKNLRYCYTAAKEDDPGLNGVMWLSLTLAEDGRIRGAVLEPRSAIKSEALASCVRRQLSTMSMPIPRGGSVTFSYPFEMTE